MRALPLPVEPRTVLRVLPRHSTLSSRLQEAVRAAVPARRLGRHQSDTMKKVIAGHTALADRLETVLAELIRNGAADADVLAVVACVESDVRAKLAARRGESVACFTTASVAETVAQGSLDVAQLEAASERTPSRLRRVLDCLTRHRSAIDSLSLAARSELVRLEGGR